MTCMEMGHYKVPVQMQSRASNGKKEEIMKIKEFMKQVAAPILLTIFLMALFRPLCMKNGECNYLFLWFLMGIPMGMCRVFFWMIPKGYDIGGTIGVLFLNLLIASVIGGVILTYRLLLAAVYLVETIAAGIAWTAKLSCKKQ